MYGLQQRVWRLGNEFDGEPNIPMHYLKKYADAQVVFRQERVVWN